MILVAELSMALDATEPPVGVRRELRLDVVEVERDWLEEGGRLT